MEPYTPAPMSTDRRHLKKQQARARREAERKRAARRELQARLLKALGFGAVVAAALLLVTFLGREDPSELPEAYQDFREQPTACDAEAPDPWQPQSFASPGEVQLPDGDLQAVLHTSCGPITLQLDADMAPEAVRSFVFLAEQGFYDATVFHRVAADFVIQGGDPRADGRGGPGYTLPDEPPPPDFTYQPGVVALANSGAPDSAGSQFFIVVGEDAATLPPRFAVIGRVVDGDATLQRIAEVPTARQPDSTERSRPLQTVYLERVEIIR